jgi:UDP-3-O-[3-hydroxymyristoyl] N-acetylglucosamine deacetylase
VRFRGVGLHSGRLAALTVAPAAAGSGIVFRRTDLPGAAAIPARHDHVCAAPLSTCLGRGSVTIGTVEHLMAALAAAGITDALIGLDGPEVPALDGSAAPFLAAFARAGLRDLGVPARAIRILRPVTVRSGDRYAGLAPAPRFEMIFRIRFADPAIGAQTKRLALAGDAVAAELADARTFGCLAEAAALRRAGLVWGASLENAVVVDGGRVLNPGGLRHADEFVRHKMLDAVGDLALTGAPIIGRYTGIKAGHALTNLLLRRLFARRDAWCWDEADVSQVPGGPLPLPPRGAAAASLAV